MHKIEREKYIKKFKISKTCPFRDLVESSKWPGQADVLIAKIHAVAEKHKVQLSELEIEIEMGSGHYGDDYSYLGMYAYGVRNKTVKELEKEIDEYVQHLKDKKARDKQRRAERAQAERDTYKRLKQKFEKRKK